MCCIGVGLTDRAAEGRGYGDEVVSLKDDAKGIDDSGADGFGGTDLLMSTPPADIEAFPYDGVVVRAAAFEPSGVHAGGGMPPERRVGLSRFLEGELQEHRGGGVFLRSCLQGDGPHGGEIVLWDTETQVAGPEACTSGRGFAEDGGRHLAEILGGARDPPLGVVARREWEDVANGRDIRRETQSPDSTVTAGYADGAGGIGRKGEGAPSRGPRRMPSRSSNRPRVVPGVPDEGSHRSAGSLR